MDSDKGLGRVLSPADEPQQEVQDIHRSDVMEIRIDDRDSLYCDGKHVSLSELQQQVESFVASRQTDRHIIAVKTNRQTSYNAYFEMQNAIVRAYHHLRDKMALKRYGHPFNQCTAEEREVIVARYPQRISEGVESKE
jgi:hypothetical protein